LSNIVAGKPPPQWPQEGDIRFEKMSLSYGEHKCVLKGITCHIKPKEKVNKLAYVCDVWLDF